MRRLAPDDAAERHETDFRVKFGSVTVGKVTFGVAMNGDHYTFTGNGRTEGLADWFAPGKAVIKSEGEVAGSSHNAASHFLSVTENKKTAVLKMAFTGGKVADVYLKPDKRKKKKAKKYVLIKPEDLVNVMDPASTMVVPGQACARARNSPFWGWKCQVSKGMPRSPNVATPRWKSVSR